MKTEFREGHERSIIDYCVPPLVYCGPFQPSLEEAFISRLKGHAAARGLIAVVAPSRRMADRLQRLACLEHGLSLMRVRFHTFHSLALEIGEESLEFNRDLNPDGLFHDKIIDRLLRQAGDGRRCSRNMSSAYRASVRDLIDAGVEPAAFRENFAAALDESTRDRRILKTLLDLLEAYLSELETASILPPAGLARLAVELIEKNHAQVLERYGELMYYGFYDLTGSQAEFFKAVTDAFPSSVFYPYLKDHPAFRYSRGFYESRLHAAGGTPVHLKFSTENRALGPALECLFDPSRHAPVRSGKIVTLSVSGARDEAWAAAKEIMALAEDKKSPVAFKDIGIVARTLEPYRAAFKDILAENGIPFSLGAGESLRRWPLARLAMSLLTLRRRDFPGSAVLDVAGSVFFHVERFAAGTKGRDLTRSWERVVERVAVHGGWQQWEGKVRPWATVDLELFPHLVEDGQAGETIPHADTARLWVWLKGLYEELDAEKIPRGWAAMVAHARRLLEENFSVAPESKAAESWAAVLAAVDGLAAFGKAAPEASWEEFLETLEERINKTELESAPENGGVRVLDAMDARGESFRVLFLIGLQEGLFPRVVRPDPLLPDAVRNWLRLTGGYGIRPKSEGSDEERQLFWLLAASASERLYCIYQRSDEEGKAAVPSSFLRELSRAASLDSEVKPDRRVARQPLEKISELSSERLSPGELSLLLALRGQSGGEFWGPLSARVERFKEHEFLAAVLERSGELPRRGEPGARDGLIPSPEAFLAGLERNGLSPHALKSLSECPFQFFARRLLRLQEPEEPAERGAVSSRFLGELYHLVLKDFYSELLSAGYWKRPDDVSWTAVLQRALEKHLSAESWRTLGIYPVLWDALRLRVRRHVERFVAEDIPELRREGLIPRFLEVKAVGRAGELLFNGKLDRVDADAALSRYRIVDYKTSWSESKKDFDKRIVRLRELQPPIYMELAGRLAGLVKAEPVSVRFSILEKRPGQAQIPSVSWSVESWRENRELLLEKILTLRGFIEKGRFFIAPNEDKDGPCQWCSYGKICRKAHVPSRRRAENSKDRAALDEARGLP